MQRAFVIWAALIASPCAFAQMSLTDQINAVDAAQKRREDDERAAQAAQRAAQQTYERRLAEQRRASAAAEASRRAEEAQAQKQREDAAWAEQQRKEAEALSDKQREQQYQDQLRALDLEEKTLRIEAQKARVARTNEYIDQELKEKSARTDVIQSTADSSRNISSGAKTFLEKTGKAEIESSQLGLRLAR
jgi:DNA-binding helix-hairpin-helix protein with protein kinase domain